jgi:precorrin-6B methylase 2
MLDGDPKTIEQASAVTGASTRGLRILANALAGVNLLAKDSEGRYSTTPESSLFLVSTKPSFQGGIYKHITSQLLPKWMQLYDVVRSGVPATAVNVQGAGAEFFEKFVADIFPMSYPAARALAAELDLASAQHDVRVLDVAAGSGVWGIALAQASPRVRVTALDWPGVLNVTRQMSQRFGLESRFEFLAGDLREADFGSGYQVATLGHILHSEGEERSRALVRKLFQALSPGGAIAIGEFLVDNERKGPVTGLIFAVNMLVNTEAGDTYSFEEISSWLAEAGFVNIRTLEAPAPSPLILATRP